VTVVIMVTRAVVIIVVAEINSHIVMVMVPIRPVIPAPSPVIVHASHIVADLAAVFAMARGITVDSRAIRF
jgi:hypothetical protein